MERLLFLRDHQFLIVLIAVCAAILCYKALTLLLSQHLRRTLAIKIPDISLDDEKNGVEEKIYSLSISRIQSLLVSSGGDRSFLLKFNPYIWVSFIICVLTFLIFSIIEITNRALIVSLVVDTVVVIFFVFFSHLKSNTYRKKYEIGFQKFLNDFELALRSGANVRSALLHGKEQSLPPLKIHLSSLIAKLDSGEAYDRCMSEFSNATPVDDTLFFTTLLSFQNRSGGSLVQQINQLKNKLENRRRRTEKMKGLTAQTRTAFKIMMLLPIIAAATSWYLDSESWLEVAEDPQFYEFIGIVLLWQLLGVLVMHYVTKP